VGKVVCSSLSLGLGLSLSVVATSTSADHLLTEDGCGNQTSLNFIIAFLSFVDSFGLLICTSMVLTNAH
jgi:hypothetical protein